MQTLIKNLIQIFFRYFILLGFISFQQFNNYYLNKNKLKNKYLNKIHSINLFFKEIIIKFFINYLIISLIILIISIKFNLLSFNIFQQKINETIFLKIPKSNCIFSTNNQFCLNVGFFFLTLLSTVFNFVVCMTF